MAPRIALIGMSGVGKSHWSSRLERRGVRRFFCDALIEERLADRLIRADGSRMGMGEWMGFPFEPGYSDREETYLAYEIEVMHEVLDRAARLNDSPKGGFVIDTTGSVIHTGRQVLDQLASVARIVYLEAPMAVQVEMHAAYEADPAPVLWRDQFRQQPGETGEQAMARSYPDLLAARSRAYRQVAHITLDFYLLRSAGFGTDEFLRAIAQNLDG